MLFSFLLGEANGVGLEGPLCGEREEEGREQEQKGKKRDGRKTPGK